MTVLELAQRYVNLTRSGNHYSGACPKCGGSAKSNKFVVYADKDDFHCFSCGLHGDAVALLRAIEDISCPDAHEQLSFDCSKRSCPAWDGCRLGARANGENQSKNKQTTSLQPPEEKKQHDFVPAQAETPEQAWQQQAAKLVEKAHAALLDCQEQIDYLAARGLPIEAIKKGQLGLLPADRFPTRISWGLDKKFDGAREIKKHLIPAGILIPFFDQKESPHRLRVRRTNAPDPNRKYFWIDGSGNDVPVIGGANRRGVVVVESDLDAYMVRWQCRDLDVSVIPLGTCSAKPKGWAMQALEKALDILVAHDFEPRQNEKTGKNENPGGQGARWWLQQFPRATRWPVPAGKDPGEYYQDHNGNIRAWILAGLSPAFHVQKRDCPQPHRGLSQDFAENPAPADCLPQHAKGKTLNGHGYVVAYHHQHIELLRRTYPEHVVFSPADMAAIKGMTPEQAELILLEQKILGGDIEATKPIGPDYQEKYMSKRPDFHPAATEQQESVTADDVPLPPEPVQDEMIY
ncbi:MAG: hypothetical protein KAT62_00650 [Desulfuromonadales bacterium]|nr:hypothetical protein [Desulfuromonadales bacterium]